VRGCFGCWRKSSRKPKSLMRLQNPRDRSGCQSKSTVQLHRCFRTGTQRSADEWPELLADSRTAPLLQEFRRLQIDLVRLGRR
jgi:hypothetical protein